jgi:dTDP-glucose 4,6-dehydratase
MKCLLLTGGTGFFGRAILRLLASSQDADNQWQEVVVLARNPRAFLSAYPEFAELPWLRFHQGDILVPGSLPQDATFEACFHAATDSTNGPLLQPLERFNQIMDGTRNMLDWALAQNVRRFLLTSSGGVYGVPPAAISYMPETWNGLPDVLNAASAYGVGKRVAEHLCSLYADTHDLEVVIARCYAFVGPDLPLDVHFAIGNFIRDALWAEEIVVNGDGTPLRSYLDQRDLARWLLTLLRHGKAGEAYNVGSDRAISIADLAHLVRDLVSPGKPVRILGKPVEGAERQRYVPDISKIGRDLGLHPSFSLEESILAAAGAANARELLGRVRASAGAILSRFN